MGVSCHLCDAPLTDAVYVHNEGRTGPMVTVACRSCSLVQTVPHATPHDVAVYYASGEYRREFPDLPRRWIDDDGQPTDEMVAPDDARYAETCTRHGAHAARRLVHGLGLEPGQRVLEVGSGDGSVAGAMHELLGGGVYVLERDSRKAGEALARGVPIHDPSTGEAEGGFDVAFALQVVEHFARPVEDMVAMVRQVREGGMVYVEVPCVERPYVSLTHFLQKPHTVNFSRHTLAALMHRAGLDDVHTDYDGAVLCGYGVRGSSGPRPYEPHGGPMAEEVVGKLKAWESERAATELAIKRMRDFEDADWRASITDDVEACGTLDFAADELVRWRACATDAIGELTSIVRLLEQAHETRPSWDADMWMRGLRAGQAQESQRIGAALAHVLNRLVSQLNKAAK